MRLIDADAIKEKFAEILESTYTGDYAKGFVNGLCAALNMPTLTPPNEWVSVEERIPNFGKLVIATDGTTYGVAWLCSDCTWMVTMGYKSQSWFGRKVTHWMSLSAPPTKEM